MERTGEWMIDGREDSRMKKWGHSRGIEGMEKAWERKAEIILWGYDEQRGE